MANFRYFMLALVLVSTLAAGCASTRTTGEQVDDGWITARVTTKLVADPEVNPFKIDVDTLDGVVTLRGEVREALARREAEQLARNTDGVRRVINEISIVTTPGEEEPLSDAWITTKVKGKLVADPQLNPFNIDVDTEDGRVTLSGKVKEAGDRSEAEKLARDTRGVVAVVNQIVVEGK